MTRQAKYRTLAENRTSIGSAPAFSITCDTKFVNMRATHLPT